MTREALYVAATRPGSPTACTSTSSRNRPGPGWPTGRPKRSTPERCWSPSPPAKGPSAPPTRPWRGVGKGHQLRTARQGAPEPGGGGHGAPLGGGAGTGRLACRRAGPAPPVGGVGRPARHHAHGRRGRRRCRGRPGPAGHRPTGTGARGRGRQAAQGLATLSPGDRPRPRKQGHGGRAGAPGRPARRQRHGPSRRRTRGRHRPGVPGTWPRRPCGRAPWAKPFGAAAGGPPWPRLGGTASASSPPTGTAGVSPPAALSGTWPTSGRSPRPPTATGRAGRRGGGSVGRSFGLKRQARGTVARAWGPDRSGYMIPVLGPSGQKRPVIAHRTPALTRLTRAVGASFSVIMSATATVLANGAVIPIMRLGGYHSSTHARRSRRADMRLPRQPCRRRRTSYRSSRRGRRSSASAHRPSLSFAPASSLSSLRRPS